MIDIRMVRDDSAVGEGRPRPTGSGSGRGRPSGRARRGGPEPPSAAGTSSGPRSSPSPDRWVRPGGPGMSAAAEELAARSRRSGDEERALSAVADAAQDEVRQALLVPAQPPVGRRPRRGRARGQRGGPVVARPRARLHRGPAGPPLGDRRGSGPAGHGARGEALGIDVPALPRVRGPVAPGTDLVRPRQPRRRLRGGPAAHPGAHRDHGVDRPPPEVRGGRLPHRARRPLGHPDRRGPAHLDVAGRHPRRGRPARCG